MAQQIKKRTGHLGFGAMLSSDLHRMFSQSLLKIFAAISFIVPILVLVMTTGMGKDAAAFTNVWQVIGSVSGTGNAMAMDMLSMCNMNLIYFGIAVFVCLFIGNDFQSGYAKHLFTVRAKRVSYSVSKLICCVLAGTFMILAFFLGAQIGGKAAGLPFAMEGFTSENLIACMLAKVFLLAVFAAIYEFAAIMARHRTWLAILLSLAIGMLLFMLIPMLTPLNAGAVHVMGCLLGGVLFGAVSAVGSGKLLEKMSVV